MTRVLVAHDAGARMFEHQGPGKALLPLTEIPFEDGCRHPGELDADRRGRVGAGPGTHASEPPKNTREHAVESFAKLIAADLARAHHLGRFDQLVLVAPPRFLGLLREAMSVQLVRVTVASLPKDLPRASPQELARQLAGCLAC